MATVGSVNFTSIDANDLHSTEGISGKKVLDQWISQGSKPGTVGTVGTVGTSIRLPDGDVQTDQTDTQAAMIQDLASRLQKETVELMKGETLSPSAASSFKCCDSDTCRLNIGAQSPQKGRISNGAAERIGLSVFESYKRAFSNNESKKQSYDRFITYGWPQLIKNHSPIIIRYTNQFHILDIEAITMNSPIMTETDGTSHPLDPNEARIRGETYALDMYFHVRYRVFEFPSNEDHPLDFVLNNGRVTHDTFTSYVKAIKFPLMVGGVGCKSHDLGGYFITDGQEKMLMFRERLSYDKIFLHPMKDGPTSHVLEFRSSHFDQFKSTQTLKLELTRSTKQALPSLQIQIQNGQSVPWVTMMRAMGIVTAKRIYTLTRFLARGRWSKTYKVLLRNSLNAQDATEIGIDGKPLPLTRGAALAHIGRLSAAGGEKKSVELLQKLGLLYIRNKFLPNIGYDEDNDFNKAVALCLFACKLFDYVENSSLRTNKDSYRNKCVESCEELFGNLCRQHLVTWFQSIKVIIMKKLSLGKVIDIHEIFSEDKVGRGTKESISSGTWHATKGKGTQTGVSQKFDRANFIATQAQHQKVINQMRKEVKQISPRQLPSTAYGTTCLADSPEGQACGLIKFNAILQHQSIGTSGNTITNLLLNECGIIPFEKITRDEMERYIDQKIKFCVVIVNGRPFGIHADSVAVNAFVGRCKAELRISPDTGHNDYGDTVEVRTDRGRNLRPLFVAKNMWKLSKAFGGVSTTAAPATSSPCQSDEGCGHALCIKEAAARVKVAAAQSPEFDFVKDFTQDGNKLFSPIHWSRFLEEEIVEYVDKEQEQDLLFAAELREYLAGFPLKGEEGYGTGLSYPKGYSPTDCIARGESADKARSYTHVEIHGSIIFGISASLIPFSNHDQSPRNTYECAMIRQAHGNSMLNAKSQMMYTTSSEMWYPQRPIVETKMHQMLGCHNYPYGQNVMVAVMATGECNQEDSTISSQAAIDFGMLRSSIYRTTTISEKKYGKSDNTEIFKRVPEDQVSGKKRGNYSNLEEDALAAIGSPVDPGTILAQKVSAIKKGSSAYRAHGTSGGAGGTTFEWKELSVSTQNNEFGRIDKITITSTACGVKSVKIRVVRVAVTKEGDKFATRYGQKGICGEIKPLVDLIYNEDGETPQFIINLIAFSSRMTWGEWLETLLASAALANGKYGDATPFSTLYRNALVSELEQKYHHLRDWSGGTPQNPQTPGDFIKEGPEKQEAANHVVDEICSALTRMGLDSCGEHVFYSGTTGKQLKGRIFMGFAYLQKLKHMVDDKHRARARGRNQTLNKQAVEGRSVGGGVKYGEMEKDCTDAHGAAYCLLDRMCYSSDPEYLHLCKTCNNTVVYEEKSKQVWCTFCNKYDDAGVILTTTTFVKLTQELRGFNADFKFEIEEIE
jgi:DNA-directed RNA polymerase II subunit RPB2